MSIGIVPDAVRDCPEPHPLDFEASLLENLSFRTGADLFAELEMAAWECPLSYIYMSILPKERNSMV